MESLPWSVRGGVRCLIFILGFLVVSGLGLTVAREGVVPAGHRPNEFSYGHRRHRADGALQGGFTPASVAFIARTLPPPYTTVWLGSSTYYRAAGAYYLWDPLEEEYEVAAPPSGIEFAVCSEASAGVAPFNGPWSVLAGRRGLKGFPRMEYALGALRLELE